MVELLGNRSESRAGTCFAEGFAKGSSPSVLTASLSSFPHPGLSKGLTNVRQVHLLMPQDLRSSGNGSSFLCFVTEEPNWQIRNSLLLPFQTSACSEWIEPRIDIHTIEISCPQNVYHIERTDGSSATITGSSPLTIAGLGLDPASGFATNTLVGRTDEATEPLEWFDSTRNSTGPSNEKRQLLCRLPKVHYNKPPKLIYYAIPWNVFQDSIGELTEYQIIRSRTDINDMLVWNNLYRFKHDGLHRAINRIELYNDRVPVVCTNKLQENWTIYMINNRRNLCAANRFNYDVVNHTDLTCLQGEFGEINIATLSWGNYDLVVIDESHNFCNAPPRNGGLTTYWQLMREIIQEGVKTKMLMLSATPLNNLINDLKGQIAFITEAVDDLVDPNRISVIEHTLRRAQRHSNHWIRQSPVERTVDKLVDALHITYFKLLDLLTIVRSCKHIEKCYERSGLADFPKRNKSINIEATTGFANLAYFEHSFQEMSKKDFQKKRGLENAQQKNHCLFSSWLDSMLVLRTLFVPQQGHGGIVNWKRSTSYSLL